MTVFGPGDAGEPTAAEWAKWAETLEHEIVTGLGPRLHRITVGEPPAAPTAPDPDEDPMSSLRVAVIGGGTSCEHDVSLASAGAAGAALSEAGHEVVPLTIDRDGMWRDGDGSPIGLAGAADVLRGCAVAVPMLHGPGGEDGTLAALCDLVDVPYVGSALGASAIAMDKWVDQAGRRGCRRADRAGPAGHPGHRRPVVFTHPVVVKPVAAGSSYGVSMVRDASELAAALDTAFAVDDRVLVEDVVVGREIDLAVLGRPDGSRTVPPALEIVVPESGIFDLDSKYDGSAVFRIPAPVSDADRDGAGAGGRRRLRRRRVRGHRPGRLLPHRARAGAERDQHDPGIHRALAGAADVRGGRHVVPGAARHHGPRGRLRPGGRSSV